VPASQLLPLFVAFVAAALLAPAGLRALSAGPLARENYRGVRLPFPAGTVIVAAAALALAPLAILDELADVDVFRSDLGRVAIYVLGVAFLGLVDDAVGAEPRGWRGHGAAVLGGGLSTGALKAAGSLGLALYALSARGYAAGEYVLAVLVVVLTTNLFNLLDLRPGRSFKVFVLLGAALTLADWDAGPLATLGLFVGPVLLLGVYDLRERSMLGDTGSNVIGGLAGLWLVFTLGTVGQGIALGVVLAATVYGEFRSISALIERSPLLRQLDSLGRPA
jgi:UDP-N-acetylmuramyl pentapeptide phosphotransferase/UDP-N-acetylglucosamine-1-phosphate transferase